ncbi:hypothetical protein ALP38_102267 [Pseudomonas amygdali pv. sesami]|nr:hypothetical protein ALO93_102603 [Pseudomonas amygdali pv. sesami]RMT94023.1 hypothetical protein ALP38_102267 [Pseudomonas amygdali pv. sesami]RMU05261.1 hypothetical protein ALP37_102445 [Pseudomonas amygdali pv. sesami]RMV80497.1 hypothetical protein ALP04_102677 [Pseudomonas amygdali pv. sesami]
MHGGAIQVLNSAIRVLQGLAICCRNTSIRITDRTIGVEDTV